MTHLIFLPGASGSTEFWQPLIELLSADYTVQVIAYPGFGQEPAQNEVYDFNSLSDYVLDQIQQDSVLVAQSMGGIFAIQAALKKSNLIKAMVLIATSGGIDLSPFEVEDWRTAYKNQFLNYPDWFSTVQLDYSSQLSAIQQKTLLLWGDADPISPVAVGQYLHQTLKDSSFQVIQGGDHLFAAQHATETAAWVSDFLNSLESRARDS
ncbi:MAG: alpha/beta fold hydrolase [Acinetobacter sp.]|jgi:pimeloyl-ACP methyl ester carboxylesterase|uniref:alpha/beta fold hydrolase n=1 Tax=unclassified Acinetobacter TaxID=196816 RepID=UPI0015D3120C|nr:MULTISPECIES: alpha/beta fold hydrolase [unclassified Acinetobacter]MDD2944263.1 alpha/beta fold hydrolase [Acinetobacter sp.]